MEDSPTQQTRSAVAQQNPPQQARGEERLRRTADTRPASTESRNGVRKVRVRKRGRFDRVGVSDLATEETIEIERVPVNRAVHGRRDPYESGEFTVIPVYEERLVTVKQLFLKEEIRLRRAVQERREDRTMRLYSESASVQDETGTKLR